MEQHVGEDLYFENSERLRVFVRTYRFVLCCGESISKVGQSVL